MLYVWYFWEWSRNTPQSAEPWLSNWVTPWAADQTLLAVTLHRAGSQLKCTKLLTAQGPYIRFKRRSNCNVSFTQLYHWTTEAAVSCLNSLYTEHGERYTSGQEPPKKTNPKTQEDYLKTDFSLGHRFQEVNTHCSWMERYLETANVRFRLPV